MTKFVLEKDLPAVEMELFAKEYPCYLFLTIGVLRENLTMDIFAYDTEFIDGEWLLKTTDIGA